MSEKKAFEVGTAVTWTEGNSEHAGTIAEIYTERITDEIAGAVVQEDASPESPAYLISMAGNQRTIKGHDELRSLD